MAILEGTMEKQYSIAEARNRLPGIVHEVERGSPVELTRRGKPVAVIVSIQDYQRLSTGKKTFTEAFEAFRKSVDLEELNFRHEDFEGLRDRSPGRDFHW
jgi:prevent-host-death family protein